MDKFSEDGEESMNFNSPTEGELSDASSFIDDDTDEISLQNKEAIVEDSFVDRHLLRCAKESERHNNTPWDIESEEDDKIISDDEDSEGEEEEPRGRYKNPFIDGEVSEDENDETSNEGGESEKDSGDEDENPREPTRKHNTTIGFPHFPPQNPDRFISFRDGGVDVGFKRKREMEKVFDQETVEKSSKRFETLDHILDDIDLDEDELSQVAIQPQPPVVSPQPTPLNTFGNTPSEARIISRAFASTEAGRVFELIDTYGDIVVVKNELTIYGRKYENQYAEALKTTLEVTSLLEQNIKVMEVGVSAKGTGKTTQINVCAYRELSDNPTSKLTSIGCRISYNVFATSKINEYIDQKENERFLQGHEPLVHVRMKNYLDMIEQDRAVFLGEVQLLACQVDSATRMFKEGFTPKIDVLVLDELKSLFRYLSSSHLSKRRAQVVDCFVALIRCSKHIKVLDADFDQPALDVLFHLLRDEKMEIFVSVNTFKNDTRIYREYEDKYDWRSKLLAKIKEGRNFGVAVNTLSVGDEIEQFIKSTVPNCRYLYINSRVTQTNLRKRYLNKDYWKPGCRKDGNGDIIEEWDGYQVVIYTPSITMGFDVDDRDYWDCMFGYFTYKSNTAAECNQMIQRLRYLMSNEVHLFISSGEFKFLKDKPFNYEVDRILLREILTKQFKEIENKIRVGGSHDIKKIVDEVVTTGNLEAMGLTEEGINYSSGWKLYIAGKQLREYLDSDYVAIWIHNLTERRLSNTHFRLEFYRILKKYVKCESDQIIDVPASRKISERQKRKESKELKLNAQMENARDIAEATTLTEAEYKEICKSKSKEIGDVYACEKYRFMDFFRLDDVDTEFVYEWKQHITHVRAIELIFFTDLIQIEELDKVELLNQICEELPHIKFLRADRQIWRDLVLACGIDLNQILSYTYVENTQVNYTLINSLLKSAIVKKRELLPTKITPNDTGDLRKLIKQLLYFIGIDLESKRRTTRTKTPEGIVVRKDKIEYTVAYEQLAAVIGVMKGHRHKNNTPMLEKLRVWETILMEKHNLQCEVPIIVPKPQEEEEEEADIGVLMESRDVHSCSLDGYTEITEDEILDIEELRE